MTTRHQTAGAILSILSTAILCSGAGFASVGAGPERLTRDPALAGNVLPGAAEGTHAGARAEGRATATPLPAAGPHGGAQPPAQGPSVFEDHVKKSGIVACARVFTGLGARMTNNVSYAAQSQWDSKAGNRHAIQALVALKPAPGGAEGQADGGIVFAAPVGGSCEGHLVRVTPVSSSCGEVAAELAKSSGSNRPLGDLSVSAMPNGSQVMLIPFEKACVTVTVLRAAE
ncbi:MAG: hypothetical protein FWD68_21115 [Alphaproteobacteria bacterium]|nr:hypothetical protein [Alphaproteobacteria bacterium]